MSLNRFLMFLPLVWALGAPAPAWAKHPKPTSTSTPTPVPTATATPTLTSVPWNGEKLYAFDARWGSKGSGLDQVNMPEDLDIASNGDLFIADTANNRILVWSADGKPITSFGSFGTRADWRNPPQFNHPMGVYVHPSRQVFVSDTLNNRIVVLDGKGQVVSSWGGPGQADGQFNQPRQLTQDHYGNICVLDSGNSRVQIFSSLGDFDSKWGSFGADPRPNTPTAQMNFPVGMALNSIDQVIVADTGNNRMEVFNSGGVPVTMQGWYGESGPYVFKEPSGVAITPTGIIAIADGASGRVVFYNSRNGDFECLGEWRAKDEILNQDYKPRFRGITCDTQNRLYVTDVQNNCILRLKPLKFAEQQTNLPTPRPTSTPVDNNPYGGVGFPIR
jgi:tripartite motif-containing protein 71